MALISQMQSEMSVTFGQRRPRLVLDPWLCLHASGPLLIQRLQRSAELWIVRELWHILDNSHYFLVRPSALVTSQADPTFAAEQWSELRGEQLRKSIRFWEQLRLSNDLSGFKLFWIGDGLSESLLPDGSGPELHAAHEQLVESLDFHLKPESPLACAQRDAVALAAALGVPILSLLDQRCFLGDLLARAGLACSAVPLDDRLGQMEADAWRALFVGCNCAPLVWNGLPLAILHISGCPTTFTETCSPSVDQFDERPAQPSFDGWGETIAHWYPLNEGAIAQRAS